MMMQHILIVSVLLPGICMRESKSKAIAKLLKHFRSNISFSEKLLSNIMKRRKGTIRY